MNLQIKSLTKTYPGKGKEGIKALNQVSLEIPEGVFGLLGPNGAGKTTLMNTLAGLQDPDEGSLTFKDLDILKNKEELRKILGYLPQEFGLYPNVSAPELLDHLALLKGLTDRAERKKTVTELLDLTNLSQYGKKPLGKYSGGMKQRFGIAQALMGEPELLIVDEPTAGLDPEERTRFYNILSEAGSRLTVILSTHIVSDIGSLCQSFALIKGGRILAQTPTEKSLEEIKGKIWKKTVEKSEEELIRQKRLILSSQFSGGKILLRVFSNKALEGFEPASPKLEDYYFAVIHPQKPLFQNS